MKLLALLLPFMFASCEVINVVMTDDGCIMQQQDQYLVGVCGNTPTFQWVNNNGQELRAQKINNNFVFFIKDEGSWRRIGAKENIDLGGAPNE